MKEQERANERSRVNPMGENDEARTKESARISEPARANERSRTNEPAPVKNRTRVDALLDFLLPPHCVGCDELLDAKRDTVFCPLCYAKYRQSCHAPCPHCGQPMAYCTCASPLLVHAGILRVSRVTVYRPDRRQAPENRLLYALKHKNLTAVRRFAADEIVAALGRAPESPDGFVVTFVPRRPDAVREYGFDHAAVLARLVAERLGLPCVTAFRRDESAREQKGLDAAERLKNARETLTLLPLADPNGRYLLVDDVMTTGASLAACAELLRDAGAVEVRAVVLAVR